MSKTTRKTSPVLPESGEGWETLEIDEPAEKLQVTFTWMEKYQGKTYRTGGIFVSLGGSRGVPCIAMMAGDEKYILPDEDATQWLIARGLPATIAAHMVSQAVLERDK